MATEVGSGYVSLVPSARGFGSRLDRAIGPDVTRSGSRSGRVFGTLFARQSVGPIRAGFGAIGRLAVGAFAGIAAGNFLKGTISAASDLNETVSKVGVVLGKEATPAVRRFAKRAAKDFGQSEQSALDAAATFAVFGKSAGLEGKELGKFSTELTGLASDMASFSNTSPEEAITAIGAALRGESEPIRRYGVLLDDATLRQEALKLGLIKTTKEALTPQQKVLAAQAQILKQTSDAQGDFARTSDGLANQQRILSAQFTNLKARIGTAFLPVALRVVRFFNERLLPAFSTAKDVVGNLAEAFRRGLRGDVSGVGVFGVVSRIGDRVGRLVDLLRTIDWKRLARRVVSGISAGLSGAAALWGRIEPDLSAFGDALFEGAKLTAQELIDGVRVGLETGDWEPLGLAVTDGLGRAASGARGLTEAVGRWIESVDWFALGRKSAGAAVPFAVAFIGGLTDAFITTAREHPVDVLALLVALIPVGRAAGLLGKLFGRIPVVGPILRLFERTGGALETGFGRFILRPIGRLVRFVGRALLDGFRLVFPRAGAELAHQLSLFPLRVAAAGIRLAFAAGKMMGRFIGAIRGQIRFVGAQMGLVVAAVLRPFARAGTFLLSAGRQIVAGLASGIRGAAGQVVQAARDLAGSVPGWVKKVLGIFSPSRLMRRLGEFVGEGFADGIIRTQGKVTQAAVDMAQRAADAVRDRISTLRGELQGLKDTVRSAITGIDVTSLRGGLGAMFDIDRLASRAKQFVAALAALARKGVAPSLIEAIAQAGPDGGLQAAQTIAGYSKSQIKAVNQDVAALDRFANRAASIAGQASGLPEQIAELKEIKAGVNALVRKRERDLKVVIELEDDSAPKKVRRKKLETAGAF